jgi:sugar phosphate isomerase/epimerase
MRLGGPVFAKYDDPQGWIAAVTAKGYRAAYCPVGPEADAATVGAYAQAARAADIVIAETGAWSNPLSPEAATARAALDKCKAMLSLAERIGARCCVNIAGSRGAKWDGPHPLDLTRETFDRIVQVSREIIDAVQPVRAFFTLETMPWMYPDSADSYLELVEAIDRPAMGVHFDPVNLVCSPQRYFANADLIRDFCRKLGPRIRSCHAKDILLADRLTTHLDEVRPGKGSLCYRTMLAELASLDPDTPVMLEHLPSEEEYDQAAAHIRSVADGMSITL